MNLTGRSAPSDTIKNVSSPDSRVVGEDTASGATLAGKAYTALRDLIVTLQIPPGKPINEERLSESVGVGRTPMREAIKRLESEDLVVIYPRRGTFASEINITDHWLIAELRKPLEEMAARTAAERASDAQRDHLAALAEATRDSGSDESMMRLDTEIHRAIYHATANRYLESTLNQYYNLTLRIWYLFLSRLSGMGEHVAEHEQLLHAIIGRDGDAAASIAGQHVTNFESAVFSTLRS